MKFDWPTVAVIAIGVATVIWCVERKVVDPVPVGTAVLGILALVKQKLETKREKRQARQEGYEKGLSEMPAADEGKEWIQAPKARKREPSLADLMGGAQLEPLPGYSDPPPEDIPVTHDPLGPHDPTPARSPQAIRAQKRLP